MPPTEVINLDVEIDRLHQAPLDRFVTARNTLASRLGVAGRRDEAGQVRRLEKPSMSAWAINQVFWSARREIDRLIESGDRLRAAQLASLQGKAVGMREAAVARQAAIDAVVEHAVAVLAQSGAPASRTTRQGLAVTCDAIAAHGTLPTRPPVGRLTADLDPPGLALLAALAPTPAAHPPAARAGQAPASPSAGVHTTPEAPIGTGPRRARSHSSPLAPTRPPAVRPRQADEAPASSGTTARDASAMEEARAREQAQSEALARAEFESARADSEARRRRQDSERATRQAEAAASRLDVARAEMDTARERLDAAERRARDAERSLVEARLRAEEAATATREAEGVAARARTQLDALRAAGPGQRLPASPARRAPRAPEP
jgi:hypothetical protein